MNIISLLFFLSIAINDTSGIIYDNQTNYSNGIIINRSHVNDIQTDYNNGIIITKKSELLDSELIVTPTITSIPIATSSISSGGLSDGGSSGGSGGGISSSEDFKNILKYEQHEGNLIAGQPVTFKFNLSIYEILLTGKENEYDVSIRVEILKDNPHKTTIKLESEVIQYFNVITSTKRMKEAVIRFKTNQSATLLKWNGSEWIYLESDYPYIDGSPALYEADDNYIHYDVKINSFSSFAIVKNEQIPLAKLNDTKTPSIPTAPISTANINDNKNIPLTTKQSTGFDLVITIISLIGLIYKKNKRIKNE